jgi:hypothetical protein
MICIFGERFWALCCGVAVGSPLYACRAMPREGGSR